MQLATALFLIVLAAFVFAARPRSALNRVLGALLILRGASDLFYEQMRVATSFEEAVVAHRIANWYDFPTLPLTLLFLFLLFPPASGRRATSAIALTAGSLLSGVLLAALLFEPTLLALRVPDEARPNTYTLWLPMAFVMAGFATQALAIRLAAKSATSPSGSAIQRRQAALVGLAFAVLLLNTASRALEVIVMYVFSGVLPVLPIVVSRLFAVAALLLVARPLWRIVDAFDGRSRRIVLGALGLALLTGVLDGLALIIPASPSFRFLCVAASAAFLALALVRFGLAGLGEASRPRIATLTLAAFALGALVLPAGIVLAVVGDNSTGLVAGIFLLLAAAAFSTSTRHAMVVALGRRFYLDPTDPRAVGERARVYSEALTKGAAGPEHQASLRALREELGLTEQDHMDLSLLIQRQCDRPVNEAPLLGRYQVERELGRGAFGTALLATDVGTSERVVLKRFHTGVIEEIALVEARALTAVRHRNVVSLLAVERVGGETFLVLAYAEGGTAEALLERDGPLAPERAVAIARDVLAGMDAIHTAGLAHGDVKTANILLDGEGRALLTDLGSSRSTERASADMTLTASPFLGTYATLAPELLRGSRRSREGDIYALGAVLYRLLTASHYVAIEGKDPVSVAEAILHDPPRLPHPRVPPALEAFLGRALAKIPEARFATAREASAALATAVA